MYTRLILTPGSGRACELAHPHAHSYSNLKESIIGAI